MKVVKVIDHILNFVVLTFFLLVMAFSFYALYDVYSVYDNSEMTDDILKYKPSIQGENAFGKKFALSDLTSINEDIVGWVRVDQTNIDYPVLAGKDNTAYLKTDYKGDYSPAGSIFLDYRNNRDLTDDYIVIYGHNMAKNLMFSDIKKFQEEDFFKEHSTGMLYTNHGVYRLSIISFNIIDANRSIAYKLNKNTNGHNQEIIQELLETATYKREFDVSDTDKLLLLSTCYGVGTYDRSVLLTKIEKSSSSDLIHDDTEDLKRKEEEKIEARILKENQKTNLINRVIIVIVYVLIMVMIYIRLSVAHKKKKRKKK